MIPFLNAMSIAAMDVTAPPGQQLFLGTTTWVVPAGVTSICAVAISRGGRGSQDSFSRGGGGGNLAYRNDIPVTPGETLNIVTGSVWGIQRSGTYLLGVQQTNGTLPPDFPVVVGTGFRGGTGGFGELDEMEQMAGGGAAGYTTNGGDGYPYGSTGGGGTSPYGGAGGASGGGSPQASGQNYGGGGALSSGGIVYSPGAGCVRIIHGPDRAFPNTNTGDL